MTPTARIPAPSARRLGGALAVLLLLALPASAKTTLERDWSRYNGWAVKGLELQGVPADLDGELVSGLAFHGRSRFLRSRARPDFRTGLLQNDIQRIRLFLAREGYPAAEVVATPRPEEGERRLVIALRIVPGPEVRIAAVETPGWPSDAAPPDTTAPAWLHRGARFRDADMEASRRRLQRALRDDGFAQAEVGAAVLPADTTSAVVVHAVDPGDRFDITTVTVTGCSDDLVPLARRLLNIRPPQRYSLTALDDAAFDVRSTQLFRQVSLDVAPEGPGRLELLARLENARMRSLEASVGTWSDDPWLVRSGWAHRNLLGGGRGLDVQASVAQHSQSVGGGLTWFGWLAPRARARVGADWLREDEEAYESREWRTNLSLSLRPRGRDLFQVGVSLARVSLTPKSSADALVVDRSGGLLEVWADRKWDWTDDPLFPQRGGFAKLTGTLAPPVGLTDSPYASLQADLSLYRGLGGGAVLAGRGRVGWARALGDAVVVIPNRRFYAGGVSTMRGYGRRQLGPAGDDGVPRGGDAVLLAGLEVRMPLVWRFSLAGFVDTGQVWWRPSDIRLDEIASAAGASLDIRTPLGPVRFGYAWVLGPVIEGEPASLAHFGVGYPW